METFNLDKLSPKSVLDIIEEERLEQEMIASLREQGIPVRERKKRYFDRLGVSTKRLIDWRRLERRHHELHVRRLSTWNDFITILKCLHSDATKAGLKQVWVFKDAQTTMVYDGIGYHAEEYQRLVKDNINQTKPDALLIKGKTAEHIFTLLARNNRLNRWACTYFKAFRLAVEARLMPFINDRLGYQHRGINLYHEGTFIVSNEGRCYVISSDNRGRMCFSESQVFVCG
jgi:hypothetical protein